MAITIGKGLANCRGGFGDVMKQACDLGSSCRLISEIQGHGLTARIRAFRVERFYGPRLEFMVSCVGPMFRVQKCWLGKHFL